MSNVQFNRLTILVEKEIGTKYFNEYFETSSSSHSSILSSCFTNTLNIGISAGNSDTVISYYSNDFHTYSEYLELDQKIIELIAAIIVEYIHNGAIRTDLYIGGKLSSTSLEIGKLEKTTKHIKFKLFGRRNRRVISYIAPQGLE